MSRRLWLILAVLAISSCAPRGSVELTGEEREDALAASAHAPRRFTYERTVGAPLHRIAGETEDDYRYRATFSLDGREVYEEYDIDDRRLLQVRDPAALPEKARNNPALAALWAGQWVNDSGSAPPEFVKADVIPRLLDPRVVLDKVRFLEKTEEEDLTSKQLRAAAKHDPKSTRYLRRNDKFEAHPEDGVRYDVVPAPYEGEALFRNGIPPDLDEVLERSSLYVSYWFKDGRVTRVERFFDVDIEKIADDMRKATERLAKRSGLEPSTMDIPPVPQPYREAYTFEYPSDPIRLAAPAPTATVTLPSLATLVGEQQ